MIRRFVVRVAHYPGEGRTLEYAAHWNEYPHGPGTKRVPKSKWFATQADADHFKAEFEKAANAARQAEPVADVTYPPEPLGDNRLRLDSFMVHTWLPARKKKIDPATYKSYESLTRLHITPAIGALKVTDKVLNPVRILAFYDDLAARKIALGSRRAIHSTLRAALSWAVLSNLLTRNPCFQVGRELRQSGESTGTKANPLSAADAARFLAYVDRHEEPWSPLFHFLHDTGVRVGEASALQWANVDLDNATARIESSYSAPAGGDKDTKTHQGRTIDLSTDLVTRLRAWRSAQRVESLRCGRTPRAYVFTNGRGQPQRADGGMRRVFARVLKTLGIAGKGYTLHSLRDTFASTHLSQDWGKLGWVSTQLGHANTATTETHYFAFRSTAATKRYADDIRR